MNTKTDGSNYQVALLTVTQMDIGITAIAGILQSHHVPTMIINLQTDEYGDPFTYPDAVIEDVLKLIEGVEYVGISVHDLFFQRAIFLSKRIKEKYLDIVIIMGGIHAELYPEECIAIPAVDAVCMGDGYYALLDLIENWERRDRVDILNTWVKLQNGAIRKTKNIHYLSSHEMDVLPMPDYTYDHYWLIDDTDGELRCMRDHRGVHSFKQHQIGHHNTFVVSFMTGCIHNCLYCNNWARFLKQQEISSEPVSRVRYKSPDRIIDELAFIKKHHPVEFFNIMDNDFFIRSVKQIETFAHRYKKYINIPFYIMASPPTLTEKKLQWLIDAGLVELNIGLQAIERVNVEMYNRNFHMSDSDIIKMAEIVHKYVKRRDIDVFYDFIIFNAAMTKQDLIDMINFIRKISIPFDQVSHHLTLGPEVELYKKFKQEGTVYARDLKKMYESNYHEFDLKEYQTFPNLYYNLVLEWMAGRHDEERVGRLPKKTVIFFSEPPMQQLKNTNLVLYNKLLAISRTTDDIRDFLLHEKVVSVLETDYDVLRLINDNLTQLLYSNQRHVGVYHD